MNEKSFNGFADKGQLHSECNEETGCGIKMEIEGSGREIEIERDEAVIVPEAFLSTCFSDSFCKNPVKYSMTGTMKQIASAINSIGGGENFEAGAVILKNGRKFNNPRQTERNRRLNPHKIKSGSVIINRKNMLNPEKMTFEGTTHEIASQINSYGGNGVELMKEGGLVDILSKGGSVENPKISSSKEIEKESQKLQNFLQKKSEKEAKRLIEFHEIRNTRQGEAVEIGIMTHAFDDYITVFKQRERLLTWAKDKKNDVLFVVAFSGGKDSVAMVLHLLFDQGIPAENIELWHHEVDGKGEDLWDWKCTTSYCKAFAKAFGLKILFSYRDGGITKEIFRGLNGKETVAGTYFQKTPEGEYFYNAPRTQEKDFKEKLKFPAIVSDLNTRWCSANAKIDVMKRAINNDDRFLTRNTIICTGERRLESRNRSQYMEIEPYNFASGRNILTYRPVIDWTETKVWEYYEKFSIQCHPAYEIGWGRCSCQICIFSSPNHWATNNEISPNKIQRIAEIEKIIGSTLNNDVLKEIIEVGGKMKSVKVFDKNGNPVMKNIYDSKVNNGQSFLTKSTAERWIKELTGEFISPIFVEEWKLPKGAYFGDDCGAD